MTAIAAIALKEIGDGMRNRWVVAATLVLAALALGLAFLGGAPSGSLGASRLAVTVVSLASLSIFLLPLIALLLSYDAIIGEIERGTMLLLLTYPVARWQVIGGKFLGHLVLLALATGLGYGSAGVALAVGGGAEGEGWAPFLALIGSSIMLGAAFLALGYLASALVRERGTAAGLAVGTWLVFVLLFDLVLLGWLAATEGRALSPRLFGLMLMANPADVYRLLNLAGFSEVRQFSGLTGASGQAGLGAGVLTAVLAGWIVAPLALAWAVFARRQL